MSERGLIFVAKLTFTLLLLLAVGLTATVSTHASDRLGADTTQQLQSSVHRLTARLNSEQCSLETSEGWRRHLALNVLETQAAKGEQADVRVLQQLLQRFESGVSGLEHPVFANVKTSLHAQIESLNAANLSSLAGAIASAPQSFRPISVRRMEHLAEQAKNELESLVVFYRSERSSYDRANAFYTLQIDQAIEFLDGMEYELPPEISVGKMTSMIRDLQEKLDVVVEKIDAMPFRSGDTNSDDDDKSETLELVTPSPDDDDDDDDDKVDDDDDDKVDGDAAKDASLDPDVPSPDQDDIDLKELKKQQESLESRLAELKKRRKNIRKKDLPRLRTRAKNLKRLFQFEKGFAIADDYGGPYFTSAQLALERFVRAYYYGTDDNLQEDYLLRIERLVEQLPKLNDPTDRMAAGVVGTTLDWLESTYQSPRLVTSIRRRYSLPNVYLSVSGRLLNRIGSRSQSESRPIYESMDGRLARGHASTNGQVMFDLIDDPNQVHISIHANADISSSIYLQQRKLYAFVDAAGRAEARRSLFLNAGGLFAGEPYAAANIGTFFRGTSSSCNLVNRIAQQKFAENQATGELRVSARARDELLDRFTVETNSPIDQGKSAIAEARLRVRNKSNYIPEIYATTRLNRIHLIGKKASKATLAAPNLPSQFGGDNDVELRLHDSLLSNYLHSVFSGKTFTNKELIGELEKMTGKPIVIGPQPDANAGEVAGQENGNEDEGDGEKEEESFSITFSTVRPIQFEFEDNVLAVIVSGRSFAQGDRKIDAGLTIKVRFRITRENGKLQLVRAGKAVLDYVDPENKNAKIVGFRSFLDGRLNPKEADAKPIPLPDNLLPIDQVEALKNRPVANAMELSQCRIEKGWLYLGWNYQPEDDTLSRPVDTPAIWNDATIDAMDSSYTPVSQ